MNHVESDQSEGLDPGTTMRSQTPKFDSPNDRMELSPILEYKS